MEKFNLHVFIIELSQLDLVFKSLRSIHILLNVFSIWIRTELHQQLVKLLFKNVVIYNNDSKSSKKLNKKICVLDLYLEQLPFSKYYDHLISMMNDKWMNTTLIEKYIYQILNHNFRKIIWKEFKLTFNL